MDDKKTKANAWDKAKEYKLLRHEPDRSKRYSEPEEIDSGVNFFVLMIEQFGYKTMWSCEGHPTKKCKDEFYMIMKCPYEFARAVVSCGYMKVEVCGGMNQFRLSMDKFSMEEKDTYFRWAAEAWERVLGELDFSKIKDSLR